jgi:hypothetical protein
MKRSFVILVSLGVLFQGALLKAQDDEIIEFRQSYRLNPGRTAEIFVEVDAGVVVIEKSSEKSQAEVYMRFLEDEFRESVDFDKDGNRLEVELDARDWSMDLDEDEAKVHILLPEEVDLVLDARVKAGEIEMSLGGLRIKELTFINWAGEVEIRFDEPNRIPMEILDLSLKIGESRLIGLGNARFDFADINGGIGSMRADFSGEPLNHSRAKVDLDIGEAVLIFPEDLGVKMRIGGTFSFLSSKDVDRAFYKRGDFYYSDAYRDADKKLQVKVTPGLGELRVDTR